MDTPNQVIDIDNDLPNSRKYILAIQHVFAMFGATVLVPTLTGMSPSVALIGAGIGTLLFHFITGGRVPVFLGSSFAFIGVIQTLGGNTVDGVYSLDPQKFPYALGALFFAGIIYIFFSLIVRVVGLNVIQKIFPPIVTGPVIMVIGLSLSPIAVNMASSNWILASIALGVLVGISIFAKGFLKMMPIVCAVAAGYIAAVCLGVVDFEPIKAAMGERIFINSDIFATPKFTLEALFLVAPIALVSCMEHVGDVTTNGAVVGKNFLKDPGLHKTLLGDGVATIVASLFGAPANTTYGENTGVLAVTGIYSPKIIRMAACFAIILGVFAPIGAILGSIPVPVMGGVSIILFGMIASIGFRQLADAKVDFSDNRNLIIIAMILVAGIGNAEITIKGFTLSGIGLSAIVGLVGNLILPQAKEKLDEKQEKAA